MNKFTARGISKDTGQFVYGFPFYDGEKWFILISQADWLEKLYKLNNNEPFSGTYNGLEDLKVEITQDPDQWFGDLDIDKKKIWQNDIATFTRKLGDEQTITIENRFSPRCLDTMKVIGNTHGISTKEGKQL